MGKDRRIGGRIVNPYLMIFQREMTPIRKLLLMHLAAGGKLTEYTVTGNPVSFDTNVAKPMSVLAAFSPVQSGTGDPSPDNVRPVTGWSGAKATRSGKNMYLYNADNVKRETTSSSSTRSVYHTGIYGDGSTKFTLSAYPKVAGQLANANANVGYFQNGIAVVVDYFIKTTEETTPTLKLPAGCELVIINTADANSGFKANLEKYNIQIEIGDTATTFEEYSGSSVSVTFPALGKNLFDGQMEYGNIGDDGKNKAASNQNYYRSVGSVSVLPSETYIISGVSTTAYQQFYTLEYNSDGDFIAGTRTQQTNGNTITITTTAGTHFVRFFFYKPEGITEGMAATLMFEKGSTASAYEPYNATAYGGTLDLTTGVLTVEWYELAKTWGDFIGKTSLGDNTRGVLSIATYPSKTVGQTEGAKCNIAPRGTGWSADSVHFYTNEGSCIVFLPNDTESSTEIQIVYPLATPLVYQLTPQEIQTLIGANVLWSDLNGDLTVTYKKKG